MLDEGGNEMKARYENFGTVGLFVPEDQGARDWLTDTAPEDAQFLGDCLAVEPRYIDGVLDAFIGDGGVVDG